MTCNYSELMDISRMSKAFMVANDTQNDEGILINSSLWMVTDLNKPTVHFVAM